MGVADGNGVPVGSRSIVAVGVPVGNITEGSVPAGGVLRVFVGDTAVEGAKTAAVKTAGCVSEGLAVTVGVIVGVVLADNVGVAELVGDGVMAWVRVAVDSVAVAAGAHASMASMRTPTTNTMYLFMFLSFP